MANNSNTPDDANLPRWRRSKDINEEIEHLGATSPVGSLDQAIGNSFYGINHRQQPGAVPMNKDISGLTFFTRPLLNLQTENLQADRRLAPLLTSDSKSLPRIIRNTLDPRLAMRASNPINCEFVDPFQAFIPFLTNNLMSIGGIRDIIADSTDSEPGSYREVFSQVDGTSLDYTAYDIDCTFRNVIGDPIMSMFHYWIHYASFVYEGVLIPYPDLLMENEIDYNTRIYRLVLDPQKTYVTKIWACGAAFPRNNPEGNSFNFEHDKPYNMANDNITVSFRCNGSMSNDPIVYKEFNDVVILFNKKMRDESRSRTMTKIPHPLLNLFNNKSCYPRINLDTFELEWWVTQEDFYAITNGYGDKGDELQGKVSKPEPLSPVELPEPLMEEEELDGDIDLSFREE